LLLAGLLAQPLGCAGQPPPAPRPGDRFRRVQLGPTPTRSANLEPVLPIFRAALVDRLRTLPGVVEALDGVPEPRPVDALLLRGELTDNSDPFVPVAAEAARTIAGRFELVGPDGGVLQRFVGRQRYAGGPGVAAFSAQGLIDLAGLFGVTVAETVGRWLAGQPIDRSPGGSGRDGRPSVRAS
jgi:hypothetical protein